MRTLSRAVLLRAAIVAAVAIAAVVLAVRGAGAPASASVSTSPSSWNLERLGGGGTVSLASLRGRPAVVDFFASWCTACRGELPEMAAVAASVSGRVTFVGVDSEETGDGLAFARDLGVGSWTLVVDSGGANSGSGLHDALGIQGLPVTAFYDATGKLVGVVPGALDGAALRARLEALFGIS